MGCAGACVQGSTCFEQYVWTVHSKLIKKVPVSQFITSIFNLKATFNNNACFGPEHTIDQTCSFEQSLFQPQPGTYLFVGKMHFVCISLVVHICYWFFSNASACIVVFPFNSIIGRQDTTVDAPPTSKLLLPMSFEILIYFVDWFVKSLGPSPPIWCFPFPFIASEPLLNSMHISMQQKLLFMWMWMTTDRCHELNFKEKKII